MTSSPSALIQHYDARAEIYDTQTTFHVSLAEEYVKYVKPRAGETLLDLACGTGLVGFTLLSHAPLSHIHGVDLSTGMLNIARSKIPSFPGPEFTFTHASITSLSSIPSLHHNDDTTNSVPVPKTFNTITLCSAFILLPNPLATLHSFLPYLEPGGRLIFDVPHPRSMLGLGIFSRLSSEVGINLMGMTGSGREWITGAESVAKLMREAGLVNVHMLETRVFADIPAATPVVCGGENVGRVLEGGVREWEATDEVGERVFEEMCKGGGMERWREDEDGMKRRRWIEEWKKLAEEDGFVREEGRLLIGVGFRDLE